MTAQAAGWAEGDPRTWPVTTDNPYWRAVCRLPLKYEQYWPAGWQVDWYHSLRTWLDGGKQGRFPTMREDLTWRYAWAITDPRSLAFVAGAAPPEGLVEVGAGTGYWAWQLAQLGVTTLAFDRDPPHERPNHFHAPRRRGEARGPNDHRRPVFYPVAEGGPEVVAGDDGRALFLCWPPYDAPLAADALAAYDGTRVIYVGEGEGGCTGDDRFHAMLHTRWDEVATWQPVQFWGIHDWITVYERRRRRRPRGRSPR